MFADLALEGEAWWLICCSLVEGGGLEDDEEESPMRPMAGIRWRGGGWGRRCSLPARKDGREKWNE